MLTAIAASVNAVSVGEREGLLMARDAAGRTWDSEAV